LEHGTSLLHLLLGELFPFSHEATEELGTFHRSGLLSSLRLRFVQLNPCPHALFKLGSLLSPEEASQLPLLKKTKLGPMSVVLQGMLCLLPSAENGVRHPKPPLRRNNLSNGSIPHTTRSVASPGQESVPKQVPLALHSHQSNANRPSERMAPSLEHRAHNCVVHIFRNN